MEITTLLEYSERSQLRAWLKENHSKEKECWVVMSRSKTPPPGILPYIDVVEEALCFGWILTALSRSFLTVVLRSDSPFAARKVIGPS